MPRLLRTMLPDGCFHVTARAVGDFDLFVDDTDRREFLWLLGRATAQLDLRCLAYCLMNTHYHLLLEGTSADLSAAMRLVNSRYAQRFNARHHRFGHLFAERYSAYAIRDEEHLERAREYIALNPVKAGLCELPADWRWTWIAESELDGLGGRVPVPAPRAA